MKPQPKEINFKLWMHEQAVKLDITTGALNMRIARGKHPAPKLRKVNRRVMFVVNETL